MRVLVHGGSVPARSRLGLAAQGLARRGHVVVWSGGIPPPLDPAEAPDLVAAGGGLAAARAEADVALGGGGALLGAAIAGWLARARVLVLALDAARLERWDWAARAAWSSLHATGLVDPGEADALARSRLPVPHERLALWPDGEPAAAPTAGHADTEILERACERALARQRGHGLRPAAFLDRDGTLIREHGHLGDPAGVELLPRAADAVAALRAAGLAAVVISNQSGVARGLYTLERAHAMMAALRRALRAHGTELDAVYFCPHAPEDGCRCRKPGIELVERAAEDLQLALRRSVFVGDKTLDVATGHAAGTATVLVRTGYGREEEARLTAGGGPRPDRVCEDLGEAAAWILGALDLDRPA